MELKSGQVAVISGAASGIGLALAEACARRGLRLALADVDAAALARAERAFREQGVEVLAQPVDVATSQEVRDFAQAVGGRFGAVQLLCNNAGVLVAGPVQESSLADWHWSVGVNLFGVVHGIEAFVPAMLAHGQPAWVVNTASMAGLIASAGMGIYNATKAAVVSLSETLAKDLRDTAVGVSVLCPMGVDTAILESERHRPPRHREARAGAHRPPELLGRTLTPAEAAHQVLDAIASEALYVLTHSEAQPFWQRRAERISQAFPPA